MNDAVRIQLRKIIVTYGPDICQDPQRVEGLLRDLVAEHRLEISVLVASAKEGVPIGLRSAKDGAQHRVLGERLVRQLQDNTGLTEEAARWAVAAWASALDINGIAVLASANSPIQGQASVAVVPLLPSIESQRLQSVQRPPPPAQQTRPSREAVPNVSRLLPADQTITRRVQLGSPTQLPVTQRELETVRYLASAASCSDGSRFCLLRITPTFHEGKGGVIEEGFVRVTLETPGQRLPESPKVWWMRPGNIEEATTRSRNIRGASNVAPIQAGVTFGTSYEKHDPFIVAYGLQCPTAYWKFTRTRGRDIRGSHELEMVIWIPGECETEALIEIHATARIRKFGMVPVRGNLDNDSYSIALLQKDIQHTQIPHDWIW
jgi:hypothetical protein